MWILTVRDLQWRRRRFAIAVATTGLVLALALLLAGVSASFENEIHRTVDSFGADRWIVPAQSFGPFTGPSAFAATRAEAIRTLPGVRAASPVAILRATTTTPRRQNLEVIGAVPGGVGPARRAASELSTPGAAIVDRSLGLDVGDQLLLNGRPFRVAQVTKGHTYFAGVPTVVISLASAQRLAFDGRPLATAVVTDGVPQTLPPSLTALHPGDVATDLGRPVAHAKDTIAMIRWLLWAVAGAIIGAIVYLSTLERTSEFAVLKAIGVETRTLASGLIAQSVLLAVVAAAVAVVLEAAMAPASAMSVEIGASTYLLLPLLAAAVGAVASASGLRRALRTDPALAFGG